MIIEQPFLLSWLKFFLAFLPIWLGGIYLVKIATSSKRWELLITAGLIAGVSLYIFSLNSLSFFLPTKISIIISESIAIIFAILLFLDKRSKEYEKLNNKSKWLFFLSLFFWGIYLFNRAGYTGFGGDVDIYYSIAKTFAHGNFPIKSPWQPDFMVDYHYGGSLLLGALQYFTNLSFDFLHRATAFLLLLCSSQLLIWLFKRHNSFKSLLAYQLVSLIGLVGLGSFMIVWPTFPLEPPKIASIIDIPRWISNLPTGVLAFDNYGAPVVIEHFIYFYHHAVGLPIFVLIIFLLFNFKDALIYYGLFVVSMSALALINESYFIPALFASAAITILNVFRVGLYSKKNLRIILAIILLGLIVVIQGGTITSSILAKKDQPKTILFFPKKEDFDDRWGYAVIDINKYHLEQIKSRILPNTFISFSGLNQDESKWLPFKWFHVGLVLVFSSALVLITIIFFKKREKLPILIFFLMAASSAALSYFFIVPKNYYSATSRLLSISYQLAGLSIILSVIWLIEALKKKLALVVKILLIFFCVWILTPSILPSFLSFTNKTPHENLLLKPSPIYNFSSAEWLKKNINANERILDFISGSYFTNIWGKRKFSYRYGIQLSREAGVLTPLFGPKYRDLHFEASPEYLDAFYTLNPSSLKLLKINYIVIDDVYVDSLPQIRKQQLTDSRFFSPLFENFNDPYHERIYRVNNQYLLGSDDLNGTFDQLDKIIPQKSKVFVELVQQPASWMNLAKAATLILKDRDLYMKFSVPAIYATMYLQVEATIRVDDPNKVSKFDYLILYKDSDPKSICNCQSELIWQGLNNQVMVWKVI